MLSKKIAGEASLEELEYLEKLMSNNPEWKDTLESLEQLWNSKPEPIDLSHDSLSPNPRSEDSYLAHVNRLKETVSDFADEPAVLNGDHYVLETEEKPLFRRISTKILIGALLVAGVLFSYSYFYSAGSAKENTLASDRSIKTAANEIIVSKGSRSKIQLPDGSQVWINSGSKLTYPKTFADNKRELTLDGEAYFEVVRDTAHPFVVHTSGIDIKVLGTAFNVKAYNAEPVIEATLVHGSIEVVKKDQQNNGSMIMLKPHEKLIFYRYAEPDKRDQRANVTVTEPADNSSITIKPISKNIADTDIVETAWVYNKLIFEDEKFEDLAGRMEKWYNVKITIEDSKLKNNKITGSFINETIDEALKELQFLVPFRYAIEANEVKIFRK